MTTKTIAMSTRPAADLGCVPMRLTAELYRDAQRGSWLVDLSKNGQLLSERVSLLEVAATLRLCGVPRDIAGRFDRKILSRTWTGL